MTTNKEQRRLGQFQSFAEVETQLILFGLGSSDIQVNAHTAASLAQALVSFVDGVSCEITVSGDSLDDKHDPVKIVGVESMDEMVGFVIKPIDEEAGGPRDFSMSPLNQSVVSFFLGRIEVKCVNAEGGQIVWNIKPSPTYQEAPI